MTPRGLAWAALVHVPIVCLGGCDHKPHPSPSKEASSSPSLSSSASAASSSASVSAELPDTSVPEGDASGNGTQLCERIATAQRKEVLDACATKRAAAPTGWTHLTDAEALRSVLPPDGSGVACVPFSGGAWSLEIAELKFDERGGSLIGADLAVVLYRNGARIVRKEIIPDPDIGGSTIAIASDYDGDGIPELYLHTFSWGEEGGHSEQGVLFTGAGGTVKELPSASALEDIGTPIDVDGDGRLDLPTSGGIHLEKDVACGGRTDWSPARFVAHALADGTFSMTDDVAKKAAFAWCTQPPSKVTTPEEALCARLWAKTPATLGNLPKLSTCAIWDCAAESAGRAQRPHATLDCEARAKAFAAKVPFTLP